MVKMFNERIGYIGLGSMGGGIAYSIAKAGFDLTVYDVRSESYAPLLAEGAKAAYTLKELVENTDIIMICVEDDIRVLNLCIGEESILSYSRPGQVIVVQSTVKISTMTKVGEAAVSYQVGVLDCPVSANLDERRSGRLAFYVGGEENLYKRCEYLFKACCDEGRKLFYLGPLGNGQLGKLCNNAMNCTLSAAHNENYNFGHALGFTDEEIVDILNIGTGDNFETRSYPYFDDLMMEHRAGPGLIRIARKDLINAAYIALKKNIAMPFITIVGETLEDAFYSRGAYLRETKGYQFEQEMPIAFYNHLIDYEK